MRDVLEVKIPDIGDFDSVEVVEVLVSAGDRVEAEQGLLTLESDKASMDVPAPRAGVVRAVRVKPGDKVAEGTPIVDLEVEESPAPEVEASSPDSAEAPAPPSPAPAVEVRGEPPSDADLRAEVLVLGSGPGGYTAAFRAADLGKRVVLVERDRVLGGVCLNVGCIPSKALLHAAKLIDDAAAMAEHGVRFGPPELDIERLRTWKDGVVTRLVRGVTTMAKQRQVTVVHGEGRFSSPHTLDVATAEGPRRIRFEHAIVAVGSRPTTLPGLPYDDPRLIDSTGAVALADVPARLLVLGGGIIGLEMATVYRALGSKITVVELLDGLIPGCDRDLVKPLHRWIASRYESVLVGTKVTRVEPEAEGLRVFFEGGPKTPEPALFDRVLVAVGRRPNGALIGAEAAGVRVDERGFIPVDRQMRTNVAQIFAIGDVVGQPMLAHKAMHEAKVAAEVIADHRSAFDARVIPSVAYTDPEVAWAGLTETDAQAREIPYRVASFPWSASGRSLSLGRQEGKSKLLFDPESRRVIGGGLVGPHAGDLIAEVALAIEMGCEARDLALTIHPHPTLSETVAFSAEAFEGTLTDLYLPKR